MLTWEVLLWKKHMIAKLWLRFSILDETTPELAHPNPNPYLAP
jgi:hypothetical protein